MIINTAGEYTLQYTATDACGNTTTVERELVVEGPPRTVLYTDGTLIINEKSRDVEANIQAHGQPTNIYAPFDPNGATDVGKYIFDSAAARPWNSQSASITSVEIGMSIQPTSLAYWFDAFNACTSMDLSNLDTSLVTSMYNTFNTCRSMTEIDLSGFDVSSVTNMERTFYGCDHAITINVSGWDVSSVTTMKEMFWGCNALANLDLSSFNAKNVTTTYNMFYNCNALTVLDLSNFDTQNLINTYGMFYSATGLTTIYASDKFVTSQITDSNNMFYLNPNLTGGQGTSFSYSNTDKTYARIDNPPDAPGYFTAKS